MIIPISICGKRLQEINGDLVMTTRLVAEGYGVAESVIRNHKQRSADELKQGVHWAAVTICDSSSNGVFQRRKTTVWTLRGIIRLGMFIKSKTAKEFRDAAEEFLFNHLDQAKAKLATLEAEAAKHSQLADQISLERFRLVDPGTPRPGQHQLRRGCWVKSKKRNEKALEFHGAKGAVQLLMTALLDGASQFQLEECGESGETRGAGQQKQSV